MKTLRILCEAAVLFLLSLICVSCAGIPKGTKAVEGFELEKYLGKWYEIARLDFKYEKNLDSTTALYSLNKDGTVKVVNSGYNYVTNKMQRAIGVAKFRSSDSSVAELKVSFFGPFYGSYNVIALDPDYKYALVAGRSTKYLWILSREKSISEGVKSEFLKTAQKAGFNTSELIWVNQSR